MTSSFLRHILLTALYLFFFNDATFELGFSQTDIAILNSIYFPICGYEPNCSENNTYFDVQPNDLNKKCCGTCSCDFPSCIEPLERPNCCPGILNPTNDRFDKESCINPVVQSMYAHHVAYKRSSIMIDTCPDDKEHDHVDKCINSNKYTAIDTKQPVSVIGKDRVVVFKNIYCAYCHHGTNEEFVLWSPRLDCFRFYVYDSMITLHIILTALESPNCVLQFEPPLQINYEDLRSCGQYISQCNVTGRWKKYDSLLENACRSFFTEFMDRYRNVFCYMCNNDVSHDDLVDSCRSQLLLGDYDNTPTFSGTLNFIPDPPGEFTMPISDPECQSNDVFDPLQNKCLELLCGMSNVYINGDCAPVIRKISYGGSIIVVLSMNQLQSTSNSTDLTGAISDYMKNLFGENEYDTYTTNITVYRRDDYDLIESDIVAYFHLTMGEQYNPNDEMFEYSLVEQILRLHNRTISVRERNNVEHLFTVELDTIDALRNIEASENNSIGSFYQTLIPVYFCPTVSLNTSFYKFEKTASGITLSHFGIEIKRYDFMMDYYDYRYPFITVCRDTFEDFLRKINMFYKKTSNGNETEINDSLDQRFPGRYPNSNDTLVMDSSSATTLKSAIYLIVYIHSVIYALASNIITM